MFSHVVKTYGHECLQHGMTNDDNISSFVKTYDTIEYTPETVIYWSKIVDQHNLSINFYEHIFYRYVCQKQFLDILKDNLVINRLSQQFCYDYDNSFDLKYYESIVSYICNYLHITKMQFKSDSHRLFCVPSSIIELVVHRHNFFSCRLPVSLEHLTIKINYREDIFDGDMEHEIPVLLDDFKMYIKDMLNSIIEQYNNKSLPALQTVSICTMWHDKDDFKKQTGGNYITYPIAEVIGYTGTDIVEYLYGSIFPRFCADLDEYSDEYYDGYLDEYSDEYSDGYLDVDLDEILEGTLILRCNE